jgi:hypothetical protein
VIDEAELRRMSPEERACLLRAIAAIDEPHPLDDPRLLRWRRPAERIIAVVCVGLAAWIGLLAVTLPSRYTATEWAPAWVGFDVALLAAFAATGWALWQRRQVVIGCLVVTATLLCCDAWFDCVLDWGTSGFWLSLASALLAELPVAAVLVLRARWLLRMTMRMVMSQTGHIGPVPPLWRIGLFDTEAGEPVVTGVPARRDARRPDGAARDTPPA